VQRVTRVQVDRLLEFYNPFRQFFFVKRQRKDFMLKGIGLSRVRRAKLIAGRDAVEPKSGSDSVYRRWHTGRIRYFVELLERGDRLDPIEIDNQCDRGGIYGPILLDGHHRLCAAALLKTPTIRASYGGRVDFLKYLTGKTNHPPEI
jgi:hypothetical protein